MSARHLVPALWESAAMWEVSAPLESGLLSGTPGATLGLTPQGRSLRAGQWGWALGLHGGAGFPGPANGELPLALVGGSGGRDPACRPGAPFAALSWFTCCPSWSSCVPTCLEQTANRGAQELACVRRPQWRRRLLGLASRCWAHGLGGPAPVRAALTEDTLPTPCPGIGEVQPG